MGFRFRRSLKIAPGARINIGKRGISSLGAGGFNFGKRGVFHNANIPGTGISYRSKLSRESTQRKPGVSEPQKPQSTVMSVKLGLREDGTLIFQDQKDNPLSDALVRVAKKQNAVSISTFLQEQCDKYNAEIEALLRIHLHTPAPTGEIDVNPKPEPPQINSHGLISSLFDSQRQKIDERNRQSADAYEKAMQEWKLAEHVLRTDTEVMSSVISSAFESIEWPRETLVSFEITDEGRAVFLDVDLPEIEEIPTQEAQVNKRDYRIVVKERSLSQIQLDYLTHIHAIGFRFIGDVFAHLPSASTVVFSGYSQRRNKKQGGIEDEYLYSVRVSREAWGRINFDALDTIDVVACFEQFDLRRNVTKRGIISPIEPFEKPVALEMRAQQKLCAQCGEMNSSEFKFCASCGTPLDMPKTQSQTKQCARCGEINPPEFSFCGSCGTRL